MGVFVSSDFVHIYPFMFLFTLCKGDAYSRARWNKFREDVSGLGERVAGVERNVQSLDKRQREADSKAKDREKEITELQSLRLENSRLKVRRETFLRVLS